MDKGILEKTVDQVIDYYRPYNVEKRRNNELVNFKAISRYFSELCLKDFKDREHLEALGIDYLRERLKI